MVRRPAARAARHGRDHLTLHPRTAGTASTNGESVHGRLRAIRSSGLTSPELVTAPPPPVTACQPRPPDQDQGQAAGKQAPEASRLGVGNNTERHHQ